MQIVRWMGKNQYFFRKRVKKSFDHCNDGINNLESVLIDLDMDASVDY